MISLVMAVYVSLLSTISLFPYEAAVFNSFGAELAFCFCVSSTVDPQKPTRRPSAAREPIYVRQARLKHASLS